MQSDMMGLKRSSMVIVDKSINVLEIIELYIELNEFYGM